MTNEVYYDTEIAPVLAELARKCHARDMPMLACVEYNEDGDRGITKALPEQTTSSAMRTFDRAIQCGVGRGFNIDRFILGAMKQARAHGHSSACLEVLLQSPAKDGCC